MNNQMGNVKLAALVVAISSLLGVSCGGDDAPTPSSPSTSDGGSQLANPASEYCVDQGGTIEIVDEPAGQVGYCNLADGTRIEEWEYFYANHSSDTTG